MMLFNRDGRVFVGRRIDTADAWRWVDLDRLVELIVPFKRDVYREVVAEFRHLAAPLAGEAGPRAS
jgi:putative (di)nucleoside polyphosphate hydrolase